MASLSCSHYHPVTIMHYHAVDTCHNAIMQTHNSPRSQVLFFNPPPQKKQTLLRRSRVEVLPHPNPHSIYTAPFPHHCSPDETTPSEPSRLSLNSDQSRSSSQLISHPHPTLQGISALEMRREGGNVVWGGLSHLEKKVATLRRTVSQNRAMKEGRIASIEGKVERLREEYLKKERKLAFLVQKVNSNF